MKRKFLSILLTLAMALTLLPVSAMAGGADPACKEDADCHHKVAKKDDSSFSNEEVAHFDTLTDAIRLGQMETPPTFKLLDDLTEDVVVPAGKDIYLDLNGHKLTNASGHTITVEKDGKLNISDSVGTGVVDNTSHGKAAIYNEGEVTLNGGSFERSKEAGKNASENGGNSFYTVLNHGVMSVEDGVTIKNTGKYSSLFENGYQNYNNRDGIEWPALTITGGTFDGGLNTVKNDDNATITVKGGTFKNYTQAAFQNHHIANIEGGTFIGGENAAAVLQCGACPTIDATHDKHTVTISDGTFNGDLDIRIGTASITGGAFTDLANAVKYAADNATIKLADDVTLGEKITIGKTLTLDLNGKTITENGAGDRKIAVGKTGELTIKDSAENGKIKNVITGEDGQNGSLGLIFNEGKLTIEGGTFEDVAHSDASAVKNLAGATLTIKGGTFTNIADDSAGTNAGGRGNALVYSAGTLDIQGGTFTQTKAGLTPAIKVGDGNATIKNATISTFKSTGIEVMKGTATIVNNTITVSARNSYHAVPLAVCYGGKLTVESGTYTGNEYAAYGYSSGGTLIISGGTFSAETVLAADTASETKSEIQVTDGKFTGKYRIDEKSTLAISGGLFSSDPSDYVAADHYVDASNNGDYPYTVKEGTKPAGALIVVKDTTAVTVPDSEAIKGLTNDDKTNIANKSSVDGVAEAIADNKAALIPADVNTTDAKKVEIEVTVKVNVTGADMTSENKTLTYDVSPVATITVTKANGTIETKNDVKVPNSMLNGNAITVKLPLPTDFNPKQILHKFTGGGYEYFINETEGSKRGAGSFKIEDGCAVFTIYGFSTFELSGTVTYVEPSSGGGSSSSRRYDVSAPSVKHGDVTVSPKNASKGDTVTIIVKPDSGYELDTLTVKDASGSKIKVKDKGDGKFTFTMPASKVTVSAEFAEIETLDFADVSTDAYYYEAVKWAAKKGITGGTGDGTFNPNGSCTRAHIVTFLWRAAGSPEPKSTVSFADVPAGSYYAKAVAWAVENGITLGTTDVTFSPNAACTRAQSMTFLYRASEASASGAPAFYDVAADAYYAAAVKWATDNGITNGIGNGLFGSNNTCTRAQIVTFLWRSYMGK